MIKNIFSIPIFISDINCDEIVLENNNLRSYWPSETLTSYNNNVKINKNSSLYLLKIIGKELKNLIKDSFVLHLTNIWENNYLNNDFQENHIHVNSDFSFIIYKKCEVSKTKFFSPGNYLIESFYHNKIINKFFEKEFEPLLTKNNIIIFPSFLEHMVKKSSNVETISGNINIYNSDVYLEDNSLLIV